MSDTKRRLVITGMGCVTACGNSPEALADSLLTGSSGISSWQRFADHPYSRIGGDISDFDAGSSIQNLPGLPSDMIESAEKVLRSTPSPGQWGITAALQCWRDAALDSGEIARDRIAHVLGGHNINLEYVYKNALEYEEEPEFIDPLYGLVNFDTDVLAVICQLLTIQGPAFTAGAACASGNHALLAAVDMLRAGRADAAFVSSVASALDPVMLQGWAILNAICVEEYDDQPSLASRPFDAKRCGFVPAEGAGCILLETLDSALRRGANIYAEVLGVSASSAATRDTRPDLDAQVRAARWGLQDAGVSVDRVNLVSAHATSTPLGDAVEVAALKQILGDRAQYVPVNAPKSMLGHLMQAASIVEIIALAKQIERRQIHPTINQEAADPDLDLDFVPNQARDYEIDVALSNSFGFGGLNSTAVVGRYQP
ncbi:MAG: beta-ketoacyl-[acyl-carrier-protein] synthase family protein [Planctomycetota bacterium]